MNRPRTPRSVVDTAHPASPNHTAGFLAGAGAYTAWGLLTLYWPLLEPAGAVEILAHRILWSLVFVLAVLALRRRWRWLVGLWRQPRVLLMLMAAGCFVGLNWGCYVWAVNNGHVIEASLGYYINPLFSALLGLLVLRESLGAAQRVALVLAGIGVAWLVVLSDRAPWIALALAASFGLYGLVKKRANTGVLESLAVESATLAGPALVFLAITGASGNNHFGPDPVQDLLLVSTGLATTVPLMLFGHAVNRVPLTTVGMLQFLTPTIQFLIGLFGFHENLGSTGLGPYCLVWAGVLVFVVGDVRARRRRTQGPGPQRELP
ncbi:EamA family transporter RarD [Goodfellowiella coeruleoviolacea]|uniref:Chloramphenicol-sensitive protein RarD n=1 Tax=Goodfellowiella coeruleoviolacea TaxID=334858 RepID=A0AAE3GI13_9PSEU|nr:EamA family transporter RarD [Goodfellowiella coeruleoviolacea]MCP2167699.1 chloramphenicol-sensitive protein RarD [Goodfellowiella coeruleoviolacea]